MPLQIRRGNTAGLPATPAEGEPLFNTQTQELLIGTGSGSVAMAKKDHTHTIANVTNLQATLDAKVSTINSVSPTAGNIALSLDSLSDVVVSAPTNTQLLQFNGSNWVNATVATGGGTLDGLTDVVITTPSNGQVLKYNGTNWVNDTDSTSTGGAPTDVDYLVRTTSPSLSAERVVTDSTSVTASWATAGHVQFQRAALTGDVTASANSNATTIANGVVSTAKIADDAVTYAKIQNVSATDRILGRSTAGAGDIEEITCTAFARGLLDDTSASAMRTTIDAAATSHTHAASDIASGTLDIARIPTGTTGTTVSLGNHTHAASDIASGTLAIARIPTGTTSSTVALGDHTHAASAITSGTLAVANGGTNLGTTPSNGQLLIGNGTGYTLATLTAGSNVTITNASGAITIASSGTTGSGTKTLEAWSALDNQPPSSSYAQFDTVNSIGVLNFDTATEEYAVFVGTIPEGVTIGTTSGTAALKVRLSWTSATGVTTNTGVVWGVAFDTFSGSEAYGNGTYSSVTTNSGTAPATAGYPILTEITVNGENHGSLAAGDFYRLRISRVVGNGSDTLGYDAQLLAVELRIA